MVNSLGNLYMAHLQRTGSYRLFVDGMFIDWMEYFLVYSGTTNPIFPTVATFDSPDDHPYCGEVAFQIMEDLDHHFFFMGNPAHSTTSTKSTLDPSGGSKISDSIEPKITPPCIPWCGTTP